MIPAAVESRSQQKAGITDPGYSDLSAGEGNRTLVSSLEGYSFTIKLHPRAE